MHVIARLVYGGDKSYWGSQGFVQLRRYTAGLRITVEAPTSSLQGPQREGMC